MYILTVNVIPLITCFTHNTPVIPSYCVITCTTHIFCAVVTWTRVTLDVIRLYDNKEQKETVMVVMVWVGG